MQRFAKTFFGQDIIIFRLRVVSNFGDGDCGAGEIHTRARARNFEATRREVVSNFGDGDCGAGEIHTRARAKFRGDATRREQRKLGCVSLGKSKSGFLYPKTDFAFLYLNPKMD